MALAGAALAQAMSRRRRSMSELADAFAATRAAWPTCRRGATLRGGAILTIALTLAGCGRIGFDPVDASAGIDAWGTDAGAVDAGAVDAGAVDAGAVDAGPFDAGADGGAPDAGPPTPLCDVLPPLTVAPVLDGALDGALELHPITPVGWTETREGIPADLRARAAIAWRADGLYFYVEIDDTGLYPAVAPDPTYCGDSLELYVDADGAAVAPPAYDVPGTIQLLVASPSTETGTSTYSERYVDRTVLGPWRADGFVVVGRPGGYALESFVTAADLGLASWSLTSGARVGVDLSVGVSSVDGRTTGPAVDCGTRIGQFFLRVAEGPGACLEPFCNVSAFCTPTLLPE